MTKEDKQIIDRGIKEEWRIGDRTRLKRLLEKNLKLYRENAELENKIADIKANCDLAIEGRDIKIKELETENNKLLDVINGQDVKIADLEKQIEKMKCCALCNNYNMNYLPYWCRTNCVPMRPYEKCKCWEIKEND